MTGRQTASKIELCPACTFTFAILGSAMAASMLFAGADDLLTVSDGLDFFSGNTNNALRVSGTSDGVTVETAAFWNNGHLVIDTTTVDGNDLVNAAATTTGALVALLVT